MCVCVFYMHVLVYKCVCVGRCGFRRRKQGVENSLKTGAVEKNSKEASFLGSFFETHVISIQNLSLFGNMNRGLAAQD